MVKQLSNDLAEGIRQRFLHAQEASKHSGRSVDAGRQYVAAYVEFIHYVENMHQAVSGGASDVNAGEKARTH